LARFGREPSDDRATQLAIVERPSCGAAELEGLGRACPLADADVVVDALFGAGLTRPLAGAWARLVETLMARQEKAPIVAIDLPSGLDGDWPAPIGPAMRAVLTVTFVAPKPAHVLDPACDLCGEWRSPISDFRSRGRGKRERSTCWSPRSWARSPDAPRRTRSRAPAAVPARSGSAATLLAAIAARLTTGPCPPTSTPRSPTAARRR
jgi:hypothetical protein